MKTHEELLKTYEVLLLEDNPTVRRALALGLLDRGYNVREVSDVSQVLDLIRGGLFIDVIISSVQIPGWFGTKAISEVRKLLPAAKLIAISGAPHIGATSLGVDRLLHKPVDIQELDGVIGALLAENQINGGAVV